jgi:hypothetical protein
MKRKYSVSILTHAGKAYSFMWSCETTKLMKDEAVNILLANDLICVKKSEAKGKEIKTMVPRSAISSITCIEKETSKLDYD